MMDKNDLRKLIKEEIIKELAAYRLTDDEKFSRYQRTFYNILKDLNSRKIKLSDAMAEMQILTKEFGLWCAEWGEQETFDEIEFINKMTNKSKEESNTKD